MKIYERAAIGSPQKVVDSQEEKTLLPIVNGDATTLPQQLQVEKLPAARGTAYANMRKSIRAWGWWLVGWTIFSVISMNIPWAVALAAVAIMSFYFNDASAMFLVYAGTLLWAAIWNLLVGGEAGWVFMGAIQVVATFLAYKEYRKYRNAKAEHEAKLSQQGLSYSTSCNRESRLAWVSLVMGAFSLVGLCGFIPVCLALYYLDLDVLYQLVGVVLATIFELGVLGIPVGIAALFTGSQPKAAAAAGIALGILSALIQIIITRMAAGG